MRRLQYRRRRTAPGRIALLLIAIACAAACDKSTGKASHGMSSAEVSKTEPRQELAAPDTSEARETSTDAGPNNDAATPQRPGEVEILWAASERDRRLRVELRDLSDAQRRGLNHALGAKPEQDQFQLEMAYAPDGLPAPFSKMESVDALTPDGVRTLRVERLARYYNASGYQHFLITEVHSDPAGSLNWTLAAPAGAFPTDAALAPIQPTELDAERIQSIRTSFLDAFDTKHREKAAAGFAPEHVTVVDGQFTSPHHRLVVVAVPSESEFQGYYTSVYFADADGTRTEYIDQPELSLSTFRPLSMGDIDGDGSDEIVYETEYYEGHFVGLIDFESGYPTHSIIAGSGA